MRRCTLSRTFVCSALRLALAVAAAAAATRPSDAHRAASSRTRAHSPGRVGHLDRPRLRAACARGEVARLLRRPGLRLQRLAPTTRPTSRSASGTAVALRVELVVDSAPQRAAALLQPALRAAAVPQPGPAAPAATSSSTLATTPPTAGRGRGGRAPSRSSSPTRDDAHPARPRARRGARAVRVARLAFRRLSEPGAVGRTTTSLTHTWRRPGDRVDDRRRRCPRASAPAPICSRERVIACTTSGSVLWPCSSVSTKPGATTVTRTPACSASWRRASEKACTPNLVML